MTTYEQLREKMLDTVSRAEGQRLRPGAARRLARTQGGLTASEASEVLRELVDAGDLVQGYSASSVYVEIPCNGCHGSAHRVERPIRSVTDEHGGWWLCDEDDKARDGK